MKKYFENLAKALTGIKYSDLDQAEKNVIESIANQTPIVTDVNEAFSEQLTFGERTADKVAHFGGSWPFILIFLFIMASWVLLNIVMLKSNAFDPYPFILLNLVLSTLAALQAPVIMMSQNRQSAKDRLSAEENYAVSLKTDLAIIQLNQKVDHLTELVKKSSL